MPIYQFPNFQETYPPESRKLKRIRQFIRYHVGVNYCRREINILMSFLNGNKMWQTLFDDDKFRFHALLYKYCDKRFNKQQRLESILTTLDLCEKRFSTVFCQKLLSDKKITLFEMDELCLTLQINTVEPAEGFLAFNLSYQDQWIYNSSFTMIKSNQLLISSMQGTNAPNAQELIKTVTKKLHGIRPMFMMVYLFKLFAEHYHFKLLGISHKYQAKYRFNDNTRLLFNYDDFWQENSGTIDNTTGYWALTNEIERKSLEEIPSKKRSMYRKRYEMLDEISNNILNLTKISTN